MTISTRPIKNAVARGRFFAAPARAFTLLEVMLAAVLSLIVISAILSTFLMIGRTSFTASSYSQLEAETRRALEIFGQSARNASDLHWINAQSITLTLPSAMNTTSFVTYAYDGDPASATKDCFYCVAGSDPSATPRRVLVHNVAPDFMFQRFKLDHVVGPGNEATNDPETKQVQLTLRCSVRGATTVAATQAAVSACYVLRNKRVSS